MGRYLEPKIDSLITTLTGGGQQVGQANAEMNTVAHVSHFGALKAQGVIPVVKANFAGSSLDTTLWTETTASGGATTVTRGVGQLQTSTNSAGSVKLQSVKAGRFEAGQVTQYQSGVYAGVGVANNTRIWGLMSADEQDGLFFRWNGTTFEVVARAGGTDTAVASDSFNGQVWTPTAANNTFRIFYSAGRALFCRASAGNVVLLHAMVDSDYPLVEDLDLGLYYENTNSGNTTDVELRVRGASSSVFGDLQRFNQGGAAYQAPFGWAVAEGGFEGYDYVAKFGRNSDIDTGTSEDIWEGGGDYTGHPVSFTPETVDVSSDSANDTSAGTGARTVRITGLRTSASTRYETEDLTLNGTTAVTSSNTWWRVNSAKVLTAGSSGENAGVITVRSTTTTANVFAAIAAGYNRSTVAAWTVPAGKTAQIIALNISMARDNGSAGSAQVDVRVRPSGGVYEAVRVYEISNSFPAQPRLEFPIVAPAGADIKARVEAVSDNNTIVTAEFDILIVDN